MKVFDKPWFWILVFIMLNAILVLTSSLLPFVDLPNHLAEATIFKYYGDAGNQFSTYYQLVPWYFPNQFHIWFCSLNIFPSIELGNKAFYILYIILLPISIYLIVKELGGNVWYSLFSFTLIFGYNVTFGFAGYTIAIPFVFILFYYMILDYRREKTYLKFIHALLLVLLFTMHAQVALFGALIYGLCALYQYRKSLPRIFVSFVATLPLIFLIVNWWLLKESQEQSDTFGYLINYYSSTYFLDFYERLGLPLYENFQLAEGVYGKLIAFFITTLILLPIFLMLPRFLKGAMALCVKDKNIFVSILVVVSFSCFFFLPDELPGQSPISERFSVFFWLAFIVFASLYLPDFKNIYHKAYIIVVVAIYSIFWIDYIVSFNVANEEFNSSYFKGIENDKRLSGLIYDFKFRGRSTYLHFQNYFIVWNKGIASTKIIDYRFGIVNRRVNKEVLPEHYDWDWAKSNYLESLPYKKVDLILVKGEYPTKDNHLASFSIIDQEGSWELYENVKNKKLSTEVILKEVVKRRDINE